MLIIRAITFGLTQHRLCDLKSATSQTQTVLRKHMITRCGARHNKRRRLLPPSE